MNQTDTNDFTQFNANGTITKKCKSKGCGKLFTTSKEEANWLENKGLGMFTHCPECRKARKARRETDGK